MSYSIREDLQPNSFYQEMTEPEQGEDTSDKIDLTKIDNIVFDDVDMSDAPDFVNAWISSADHNGEAMTDDQLYDLNENSDFVHGKLIEHLY